MKCKVSSNSRIEINKFILFIIDFVIQQSTGGATNAELSTERIEFIKRLGLSAKENMSFASFSTDTNEAQ